MLRAVLVPLLLCAFGSGTLSADGDLVFHSDVSLVRVDTQVVDGSNRAIIHLHAGDFVIREDGRVAPIRNFAAENMPIDVLFLLDVSGSMRPHVQRIADAAGQALTELGKDDRMGIMVFDRNTRVRLTFNSSHQEVQHEFDRMLREERFNGGTDITRAMLDAAAYIRREGRRDARRAIVILTDDQTEFDRDDAGVGQALARADAVMCALIAPDATPYGGNRGGGQRRGGWGGGQGSGGPLGGIIFGPGGGGGSRYPGGGSGEDRHQSAGTAEIARDSGGDSMSVNDSSALEDTLERLERAAKGPLPLRLWETLPVFANDPASATKAAALIARSRPNQFDGQYGIFGLAEVLYGPFFDLAPRKEPWPAEIMSEYGKLATAAAHAGFHVHEHVINNSAVTDLLDTLERVNKVQPIDKLRWTLGHVYDISPANIARAKALGMTLGVHGAAMQAAAHMPLRKIADSGIVFGLGTDATIVSHYSPFVTLGWVVSGLDVGGNRVLDETLTRQEALIAHTRSNAYLFFQENALGSLEAGKQADLVVLDRDYMTVPVAGIKHIHPTLTMVGGRVVFTTAK